MNDERSEKSSKNRAFSTKELKDGICGIKNNSLYCYMNACLQCLLPIEEFRDYMLRADYERYRKVKCVDDHMDYL